MRRQYVAIGVVALFAALVPATLPVATSGADVVPGSAGVDTSLPATDSQVTVRGRGAFAGLAITVNQTAELVNQAVSITWEGGTPTRAANKRFHEHYLQIFQCWGDDDGTVPENPGPPPEQCVQGATAGTYGGIPGLPFPSGFQLSRIIGRTSWDNHDPSIGYVDTATGNVWRPFRAVDGTIVNVPEDSAFNPQVAGGNFWLNDLFSIVTTNEVAGAATGPNGKGAELFEVHTGLESSGLGCGQAVEPTAVGERRVPKCWIVVVPRGSAVDENSGTPMADTAEQSGVTTSPLGPAAWKNRIAIPIDLSPVGSACNLGADDRRLVGTELVLRAVASWQATLCAQPDLPPFSYATTSDAGARLQLMSSAPGGPGMAVVSRAVDPATVDPLDPPLYAPLTASGVVIGFNLERVPRTDAPVEENALEGVRVAELNLTPRIVAKLLTQSYREQVSINSTPPYDWLETNPRHLGLDPDFLRFNPELELLEIQSAKNFSGLALPAGSSDAAHQVWEWILADPEARAWLEGAPDDWGMRVNPAYATNAAANSTGFAFGDPAPDAFPKSDPYCYQGGPTGSTGDLVPPPLCGTDWLPYSRSMADAARATRAANDGARTTEDRFAFTADRIWTRDAPQYVGRRAFLSLTDSPSAAQFGVQMARLSRAGDAGADREFVAPDANGLTAGIDAMVSTVEPSTLVPDHVADAPGAYPLTILTYAMSRPYSLDQRARSQYAAFVEYAVGDGQESGLRPGLLPPGYASLPDLLRDAAMTTAAALRDPPAIDDVDDVDGSGGAAVNVESGLTSGPTAPPVVPAPAAAAPRPVAGLAVTPPPVVEVAVPTTASRPVGQPTLDVAEPEVLAGTTPIAAVARSRYALPALAALVLVSALAALEITKRPRRAASTTGDPR